MAKKQKTLNISLRCPSNDPLYPQIKKLVKKAINLLPNEVICFLLDNPIVFSTDSLQFKAAAICISHEDFKNHKYLIHFNHKVWKFSESKVIQIIHHEVAHVYLKHTSPDGISRTELDHEETDADKLVAAWSKQAVC